MKPDPYGIHAAGREAIEQFEEAAFNVLVDLGVLLNHGCLPPWHTADNFDWYNRGRKPPALTSAPEPEVEAAARWRELDLE